MHFILAFACLVLISTPTVIAACSGCGCRGGPGYRGPEGRCVGWKKLRRVCGDPPTARCTLELNRPELAHPVPGTDLRRVLPAPLDRKGIMLEQLAISRSIVNGAWLILTTFDPAKPGQSDRASIWCAALWRGSSRRLSS